MKQPAPILILLLLAAACFSLAAVIQPHASVWSQRGSDNVLKVVLGDARRLFANHFFVKADIYFHSGYYPSIFYQGKRESGHMAGHEDHDHEGEHEEGENFLGPPRDWVEKIGRHFMVTEHTHLAGNREREILPWLKISAELDPQRVETYTVAAYWLANQLHKVPEAEQFLREGLRANPNSYEILFALGRIYHDNQHDAERARNVLELALRRWNEQESGKKEPDKLALEEIVMRLAQIHEEAGRYPEAIACLEIAKTLSPAPEAIQKQIDELKQKPGPGAQPQSPGTP